MTDDRTTENFINDLTAILSIDDLHIHTRRGIIYKIIQDFSTHIKNTERQHISEEFEKICEKSWPTKDFRFEHAIPISEFTRLLAPLEGETTPNSPDLSDHEVLRQTISNVFEKWIQVCWITKADDQNLNAAHVDHPNNKCQKKLKNNMPSDWGGFPGHTENLWARYDKVGIKHIQITKSDSSIIRQKVKPADQPK